MTRIVLHIDRLVLRGVAHDFREAVANALSMELAARLAGRDNLTHLTQWDRHARVALGRIDLAPDATPAQLGAAVAQRLVGGAKG